MEEIRPEDFEEAESVTRPRWQVWGARIALAFVVIAVVLYYWSIANPL